MEASRLRLRPILMTSFAFIFGVVPLVIASGAGAEMRRSLGTAVFSGMLGVTLFGIFLTPVFFYVIYGLGETRLFMAVAMQWIGSVLLGALLRGDRLLPVADWAGRTGVGDRRRRGPGNPRRDGPADGSSAGGGRRAAEREPAAACFARRT